MTASIVGRGASHHQPLDGHPGGASNFERALFEASSRDVDWTAAAMNDFSRDQKLVLPPKVLENLRARYSAFACDDAGTLATIKRHP